MLNWMFSGQPRITPSQFGQQRVLRVMFLGGAILAFVLYLSAFCLNSVVPRHSGARGPSPGSERSSHHYYYYLRVRGDHGDEHRVELENEIVFWRTQNGTALKLERWRDRITYVQLISGESSETAANPDWQLRNEIRGLKLISVFELIVVAIAVVASIGPCQIRS